MSISLLFSGNVEVIELGRYDESHTWFTHADINGTSEAEHPRTCARGSFGNWVGRFWNTETESIVEHEVAEEEARLIYRIFMRYRAQHNLN